MPLVKYFVDVRTNSIVVYFRFSAESFTSHALYCQGRSDGGISVFIPAKSAQVNFYGVKMTSERLFNSFIPPPKKKLIPPKQISG